jgi:hypothetical protein
MADGTYTRPGSVAHNGYALGTRLTINGQQYVVRDRIGHGSSLDIWMPTCSAAVQWGRRTVKVRVGWPVDRLIKARKPLHVHVRLPGKPSNPNIGTALVCKKSRKYDYCIEYP